MCADKLIQMRSHLYTNTLICTGFCSYKENAVRVQLAFKDRPLSPVDTAIFWTEYVIRHGGAQHMRSAALDLSWYQYLLLDVLVVLLLAVVAALLVLYVIVKKLFSLCFRTSGENNTKPKAKKS
jgi:glucuronosyltransferase